jgi:glutamine amidotransferase
MCRLFGLCAGAEPVTATFWLLDAPDSLVVQSRREPDGTGLGWFDAEQHPHVAKQPLAAFEDRAFAREARTVHASSFVGHIRFASTGGLERRNTHPFRQHDRLFAHNGVVEDLEALEERVGRSGMELVRGDTDSERLFALISAEISRAGGDVSAGLVSAVRWVAESLPVFAVNVVLIAPGELWALRYPDTHELYVLERDAGEVLHHRSSHGTAVHSEHAAARPTVVVASERMDDDPSWRLLASGELVHVGSGLEVESQVVIDEPPARRLTLADLTGHARASQEPAAQKPGS